MMTWCCCAYTVFTLHNLLMLAWHWCRKHVFWWFTLLCSLYSSVAHKSAVPNCGVSSVQNYKLLLVYLIFTVMVYFSMGLLNILDTSRFNGRTVCFSSHALELMLWVLNPPSTGTVSVKTKFISNSISIELPSTIFYVFKDYWLIILLKLAEWCISLFERAILRIDN